MKAAQITILLIIIIVLINWCRGGFDFALPLVLPLLGGKKPSFYDFAGAIAIAIGILGLLRLLRNRKR
jgi:uncharacterized membrane protein YuzA (DUF378 family)